MDHSLTHPTRDDAAAVLALLHACEVAWYGAESTAADRLSTWDEPELLGAWAGLDLQRDAWISHDTDGRVRGYAAVFPEDDHVNIDHYTLPAPAWVPLAAALLHAAVQRAAELQCADAALRPVALTMQPEVGASAREAALACGFRLARRHYQMEIELGAVALEAAVLPEGIVLRTLRPGHDDHRLHVFIQEAFAGSGCVAQPFEEWRSSTMRPDHFRPDLWFLAESSGELVGAALCYDYPGYGWVRQLAVAPGCRRRGLGSALLRHLFGVFHQAGKPAVGLAVMSENAGAYRLYERAGMRRRHVYDEYEKALPATLRR